MASRHLLTFQNWHFLMFYVSTPDMKRKCCTLSVLLELFHLQNFTPASKVSFLSTFVMQCVTQEAAMSDEIDNTTACHIFSIATEWPLWFYSTNDMYVISSRTGIEWILQAHIFIRFKISSRLDNMWVGKCVDTLIVVSYKEMLKMLNWMCVDAASDGEKWFTLLLIGSYCQSRMSRTAGLCGEAANTIT